MVNLDRLKGRMLEKKVTYSKAAKATSMSITSFSKKMNDKGKFTVDEATKLSICLELTQSEMVNIFLS